MSGAKKQLLVCDAPHDAVRVARLVQPDMRDYLYDSGPIAGCTLFQELRSAALAHLAPGATLVLNLGLVDRFPSAFFRLLLQLKKEVGATGAGLLLCCLPPNAKEAFQLMDANDTFTGQVFETEAGAVYKATHPA